MDEHIYVRVAYALMLLVFMFCGCLRCCNLWNYSTGKMSDVYPARREAAIAFFGVALLFPCVAYPFGTVDTWIFVRCFWILYVPSTASLALKKFFFKEENPKRTQFRLVLVGGIPVLLSLVLFGYACMGGASLDAGHWLIDTVTVTGALLGTYLIYVLAELVVMMRRTDDEQQCASVAFPRKFGRGITAVCLAGLALAWAVFIADSATMHTVIAASAMFSGMGILITILHPQWKPSAKGLALLPAMSTEKEGRKNLLSETQLDILERQIRQLVETEKLFLEPDLTRGTLKERLDINHSYLSEVFSRRFGSLNRYLNTLRMEYALRYAAEHPNIKLTEVARVSGFGSMNTFYRAKKQYEAEHPAEAVS